MAEGAHMSVPGRAPAVLALAALLGAAAAALPAAPAAAAPLQAVVVFDGAPVALPGVDVVRTLPALDAAVVRGDAAALARLGRTPGVRGLSPDDGVRFDRKRSDGSGGVRAAEGLGGVAGQPGAGRGVRLAVIDTGVSDTPALDRQSRRLVDAVDTSTGTEVTTGPFLDGYGHGTFMATVAAGGTLPGGALPVGVAPAATVLVVKVADASGTTSLSKVMAGLDWVVRHADQVDVANLALSRERPGAAYGADPLTDAVERVRAAGVTIVVSAGNQPDRVGDPGFDPKVVSVGAADLRTRRTADFSGSGTVAGVQRPDVVANGVDVLGLVPRASVIGQQVTPRADGTIRGSGTSQAAAVVSGTAAVLLGQHPSATTAQVKASLRAASVNLPGDRDGQGLVRLPERLRSAEDGTGLDGEGDLTGEATFDASSWSASSWSASSWSASSWSASSWSASSWSASSWSSGSWSSAP